VLKKKVCERCGKEYRLRTIAENRGKYLCSDCLKHCSMCGRKIPTSRWLGQTFTFLGIGQENEPGWVGSGICEECEMRIKRDGRVKPTEPEFKGSLWRCEYCHSQNREKNELCFYCGAPRRI